MDAAKKQKAENSDIKNMNMIDEILLGEAPLSARKLDIPKLVFHFIKKFSQAHNRQVTDISRHAMDVLIHYPWPGGIQEMENILERVVILAPTKKIRKIDLPGKLLNSEPLKQGFNRGDTNHVYKTKII